MMHKTFPSFCIIGKSFKLTNTMLLWITLTNHNGAPEGSWMNQRWLALHITQIIFVGTFWRFAFNCHVLTPTFLHNIITRYLNVCSLVHSFFSLVSSWMFPFALPNILPSSWVFFLVSLLVFWLLRRVEWTTSLHVGISNWGNKSGVVGCGGSCWLFSRENFDKTQAY